MRYEQRVTRHEQNTGSYLVPRAWRLEESE